MKSVYKLLIDIGPLAVFFIFYTRSGLQEAILPHDCNCNFSNHFIHT